MFDRFTDRARKVMGLSRQEALRLRHDHIAPEHVLLGLLAEGAGAGAGALRRLGVDPAEARRAVEARVRPGDRGTEAGMLPFTPAAKRVLELALEEASDLGHTYIGTEHLLLGLVREGEGAAAGVLGDLGAGIDATRRAVRGLLGEREPDTESGGPAEAEDRGRPRHAARIEDTEDTTPPGEAARRFLATMHVEPALRILSEELGVPPPQVRAALEATVRRLSRGG